MKFLSKISTKQLIAFSVFLLMIFSLVFIERQALLPQVFKQHAALETGGINEPCNSDKTCNLDLFCIYQTDSKTQICMPSKTNPSGVLTGGGGEPCKNDGTCDNGYVCSSLNGSYYCLNIAVADTVTPFVTPSTSVNNTVVGNNVAPVTTSTTPDPMSGNPIIYAPRELGQSCNTWYSCDEQKHLACNFVYGDSGYCVERGSK